MLSCTQKKVAGAELPLSMAAGTLQLPVEPRQGVTGAWMTSRAFCPQPFWDSLVQEALTFQENSAEGDSPQRQTGYDKFERKAVACGMHEVVGITVLGITKFMILQSLWWLVNIERSKRIHWRRDVWKHKTC